MSGRKLKNESDLHVYKRKHVFFRFITKAYLKMRANELACCCFFLSYTSLAYLKLTVFQLCSVAQQRKVKG